jgi:uncharacterized protein RhaS with RHS repeats
MYLSKDPIGLLSNELNFYAYVKDTNGWIDFYGLSPSGNLDKALGGSKGDKMQAQHLIPVKVWKDNESFLSKIGMGGQRDKSSNGLLMHDNAQDARNNNKAVFHNGRHNDYNEMVNNRIQRIKRDYNKHKDPAKAKAEIEDLQKRLRNALDRDSNGGCKRLH